MAATSLLVFVSAASFDTARGQYNANWVSVDNENNPGSGDTVFDITETASVINLRIIADAKAQHNAQYGTNFNVATPSALVAAFN